MLSISIMLWYLWYILGYDMVEPIIEKIKKVGIETYSKEINYLNVVNELKEKLIPKDY